MLDDPLVAGLQSGRDPVPEGAPGRAPDVADRGVTNERDDLAERLRLSQERLCAVVGASSDVAYQMSADWSELRSLWGRGFLADAVAPSRRWLHDYIPPEAQPAVRAAFDRAIAGRSKFDLEHKIVRADGSIGWAHARAVPVCDPSGRILEWIGMATDITARREAEAERERLLGKVQAERDRMAALLASMRDEVWFAGRDRRLVPANPAARAAFALASDAAVDVDALFQSREALRPDGSLRPVDETPALRALRGETVVGAEEILRTQADGGLRYREVNAAPVRDAAQEVIGSVAVVRDVTERKRAEAALQAGEALLKAVVEGSPDAIFMKDRSSRMLLANPVTLAHIGKAAEEVIGKTDEEFLDDPEDGRAIMANDRQVMESGQAEMLDETIRRASGTYHFLTNKAPIRDPAGAVVGLVGVARDVSTLKEAEAALRDSEEKFRACFANASIGFGMSEPGGRFVDANPAFCAITGRTRDELGGLTFAELIHPDDRARYQALGESLLAGDIPAFVVESRYLRKDGRAIWVRKSVSLARNHDGRPRWILVLVEDVTARVEAEAALRDADRRKDDFLAILAHELRNPLAPISNGLRVLEAEGVDLAAAARVREMMARQVAHLQRLVDDLLDVSRITRGIVELRRERTDLAAIVNDAVSASRPRMDSLDHRLTVSLPVEPLPIDADPTRLAQALTNLLDNAAKFTEPGGRIDVAARREGAQVVVSVRDNGVGIPAGAHESVFGLFTQADSGGDRQPAGLGVGLALARALIDMHGGRIEAHSAGVGLGSEFVLRLPLAEGDDADAPAASEPTPPATANRVLVVDDSRDVADSFVMLLQSLGVEARVAYDGASALDVATAFEPDIVFLDLGMPTMDGFETARRLRKLPAGRDCRLVALTGWAQAAHRSRTRAAGFDEHLAKPADFHHLTRILSERR